jgi:hypothetical protein
MYVRCFHSPGTTFILSLSKYSVLLSLSQDAEISPLKCIVLPVLEGIAERNGRFLDVTLALQDGENERIVNKKLYETNLYTVKVLFIYFFITASFFYYLEKNLILNEQFFYEN